LIETAHLNEYAHANELMRYADGVLAVFSARMTIQQSDLNSIQYLTSLTDKHVMAVLTMVSEENAD
jgi:hypothetical protein